MRTPFHTLRFLLPSLCLLAFRASAQDVEDPSAQKPYRAVVQTGIALHWFGEQLKSFTLSAERPLNLYNHIGAQADFFFPNNEDYYRSITGGTYEVGIFAKCFFHGRFTGRRSKAYIGPDLRLGRRVYLDYGAFINERVEKTSTTVRIMARVGWQYHFGPAVLEIALPLGIEKEHFKDDNVPQNGYYYYDYSDGSRLVMAPVLLLGIGF